MTPNRTEGNGVGAGNHELDALARKLRAAALACDGLDAYEAGNVLRPLGREAVRVALNHAVASGVLILVRSLAELEARWVYQPWNGGARA